MEILTKQALSSTPLILLILAAILFIITIIMIKMRKFLIAMILTPISSLYFLVIGFGNIYAANSIELLKENYNINLDNNILSLTLKDNNSLFAKTFYNKELAIKIMQDGDQVILINLKTNETNTVNKSKFEDWIKNNGKD